MIQIVDPGQTLSPAQVDALTAKAHAYPFDVIVEIQTQYALSRASFENQVALRVTPGSRIVSIGVDPRQHYTFVRSSAALGVPSGRQVAEAGNPFFRQGNLVEGIDAILAKANQLRVEPVAPRHFVAGPDQRVVQSQAGVPIVIQENHTSAGVWWGVGGFVLVAGAVVAYVVWRTRQARQEARKAQEALTAEAAELAARNVEEQSWHDRMAKQRRAQPEPHEVSFAPTPPAYTDPPVRRVRQTSPVKRVTRAPAPTPQPSVVVVDGNRNNGLDMLIGYELGKSSAPAPAPVIIEREVTRPAPSYSYESSSSSSGDSSSSSSWGGSSDSSSSSDFGGGSDSSSGSDW